MTKDEICQKILEDFRRTSAAEISCNQPMLRWAAAQYMLVLMQSKPKT